MTVNAVRLNGVVDPQRVYGETANVGSGPSFASRLQEAVASVNDAQSFRDEIVEGAVTGQVGEVHDVMIAAEEAQLSFELMLEVRNKLLESYNTIMQMQV